MDIFEAILSRRSIRKYTDQSVPDEMILDVIKAGMNASSAGDQKPWHFIVITDRKILDAVPSVHPHCRMITEAPVAILVCGDPSREIHKDFWIQDCAAAAENILLAIQAQELGGVWTGIYPRKDRVEGMRKLLDLPEHIVPFALIPVGFPAEEKPPANRFDQSRIHYNWW